MLSHPKLMYVSDFKVPIYQFKTMKCKEFSVILKRKYNIIKYPSCQPFIDAARPLIYFASLFGIQTVEYLKENSIKNKLIKRIYALIWIVLLFILTAFVKPTNWDDTIKDIPLKILNISMGIQEILEIVYFIFITSFRNGDEYVKLYKILNNIDNHFSVCKKIIMRRRYLSLSLAVMPIVELSLTFWIRKFSVHNLVSHLIFFLLMLQGAICGFFLIHMYSNVIILNDLLLKKSRLNAARQALFKKSLHNVFVSKLMNHHKSRMSANNVCWFELMLIYDKIADSMYIFNRIYSEQVFIMFISWFMSTLLAVCRMLSPTTQYSEIIVSELILYILINSRPMLLTEISQCFVFERRKMMTIILHMKLYQEDYNNYYTDQIQLMADLVETRKLEISTNVFSVNIPVIINFTGRVVSYAVLMIQYFYLYIHEIE